jgi:hypothetical protein
MNPSFTDACACDKEELERLDTATLQRRLATYGITRDSGETDKALIIRAIASGAHRLEICLNSDNGGKFNLTDEKIDPRGRHVHGYNLLCCIDRHGLILAAIDNELRTYSMKDLEHQYDVGSLEDEEFSPPAPKCRKQFDSAIRQLGLSSNGRLLSVCTESEVQIFPSLIFYPDSAQHVDPVPLSRLRLPHPLPSNLSLQWNKQAGQETFLLLAG